MTVPQGLENFDVASHLAVSTEADSAGTDTASTATGAAAGGSSISPSVSRTRKSPSARTRKTSRANLLEDEMDVPIENGPVGATADLEGGSSADRDAQSIDKITRVLFKLFNSDQDEKTEDAPQTDDSVNCDGPTESDAAPLAKINEKKGGHQSDENPNSSLDGTPNSSEGAGAALPDDVVTQSQGATDASEKAVHDSEKQNGEESPTTTGTNVLLNLLF